MEPVGLLAAGSADADADADAEADADADADADKRPCRIFDFRKRAPGRQKKWFRGTRWTYREISQPFSREGH